MSQLEQTLNLGFAESLFCASGRLSVTDHPSWKLFGCTTDGTDQSRGFPGIEAIERSSSRPVFAIV
jgi:hypothetical protein